MTAPVLTFFNNKGGVGKTSLVYHLSWMFAQMGHRVLVADLDPQSNLTAAFLDEDVINELWESTGTATTIYGAVSPLSGVGDIIKPITRIVGENLFLLPGHVALSDFEETLAEQWPTAMGDRNLYRSFRVITAFWQAIQMSAGEVGADFIFIDVGPNLGAINRSALIATDFVVIPLGADLFSIQGLKNLGPTLREWRNLWKKRADNWARPEFALPKGLMTPIGYLCQQYSVRLKKPVAAYRKWVDRIPNVYRESVLGIGPEEVSTENDPLCLATIKHYRSLIPMAQEARKPIFSLTAADGAFGSHAVSAREAGEDFRALAVKVLSKINFREQARLFE